MLAAPATAQAGPGDYSSGQGYWSGHSVGWEAIGVLPDQGPENGEGQFDIRGPTYQFHAEVLCVEVSNQDSDSRDEAFIGLMAPGARYEAYADDNGDGSGGNSPTKDRFNLQVDDGVNCNGQARNGDVIRGDIFNDSSLAVFPF